MKFIAEREGVEPQEFPNPYDAMTALIGTDGVADVYIDIDGERVGLLHRNSEGSWSEVG